MIGNPRRMATAAVAVLVAASFTGCGRKAPPLPPQIRVADQTRDLVVVQETGTAVLEWSYPITTTAGGGVPDIELIEVWRATVPVSGEPQGTTVRDRQVKVQLLQANGEIINELDSDGLAAATRGPKLHIEDQFESLLQDDERADTVLWYAVRTRCCGGRNSAFSNIARLEPQEPPPPPEWVRGAGTHEGIELQWTQEEELTTLVERSADEELWLQLSAESIPESELLDGSAAQGATWHYRLRSVRSSEKQARVVGDPGPVMTVEHPDSYPPPAPADLVCLPEDDRVRLRWQGGAGELKYTISRSRSGRRAEVIEEAFTTTEYEDLAPPYGRLVYSVQAVDAAGNPSEAATCETVIGAEP